MSKHLPLNIGPLSIGAVCAATAAFALFGAGTASAINEYAGMTYDKASEYISQSGMTATIATRTGEALATGDCMVTGSRTASFLGSSGFSSGSQVLLYLDCNKTLAEPGHPGSSAASPEGKQVKQQISDLEWLNENPDQCSTYADYCKQLCDEYASKCSAEIQSAVG